MRAQPPSVPPSTSLAVLPLLRTALFAAAVACLPSAASAAEESLVLVPDLPLLLALIGLFVVLIFPVNALVFRPLLRVLDERDERISGTRRRAAKLEGEANRLLERYERAIAETRQESERTRRAALEEVRAESQRETASARGEAESRIEQSRRDVAVAFSDARETLRARSGDLAREAAARVLGRTL